MKKINIVLTVILLITLLGGCGGSSTGAEDNFQGSSNASSAERQDALSEADGTPSLTNGRYQDEYGGSEKYLAIDENDDISADEESLITFSLKVDTASYSNVIRYIESGNTPPTDAVKVEEMINYFNYDGKMEFNDEPFAIYTEVGPSPFDEDNLLAFVRVKTEDLDKEELPDSNLVFLIDTSGSMDSYDKLPLLKEAFGLLVENLDEDDRVSIVTYAGSSSVVLDSESGANKKSILKAIDRLSAGGSTAGADGILTAYKLAEKNFMQDGNNRIILATDGDFNVGISNTDDLAELVSEKRGNGIYLSILGFGMGNIRDDIMETLSKNGNGNYSYINSLSTANKVLVEELASNVFTIADDVKAQIEFNPENVKSFRLIGYENRMLDNEDFEDDRKDAGEIGIGTDVVIMVEITPRNQASQSLKYSAEKPVETSSGEFADELFEVRIRYKDPGESESKLMLKPVTIDDIKKNNSGDFNFAASVAAFGHILRDSEHAGGITIDEVLSMAEDSLGKDAGGYRSEHLDVLLDYKRLMR